MKQFYGTLLGLVVAVAAQAQTFYMKITDYNNKVVTAGISQLDGGNTFPDLKNYVEVSSLQYDFEQTLNMSSQSSGAGAGKIAFNPLVITKVADQLSAPLFQAMASGTAYKTIEFVSLNTNKQVVYSIMLKLVAVKTMAVSAVACGTPQCAGIAESVSFEYGAYLIQPYWQNTSGTITKGTIVGWNRIKNVADTDPTAAIVTK